MESFPIQESLEEGFLDSTTSPHAPQFLSRAQGGRLVSHLVLHRGLCFFSWSSCQGQALWVTVPREEARGADLGAQKPGSEICEAE